MTTETKKNITFLGKLNRLSVNSLFTKADVYNILKIIYNLKITKFYNLKLQNFTLSFNFLCCRRYFLL